MVIEVWSIGSVKAYERNPRNNEAAVEAVAHSIKTYGFRQPIVVDGSGTIICGHTRLKAALSLGMTEVPVHVARDLSPEQVKALRIADNKLHELATWDNALLAVELDELADLGVDVGLLGFTPEQIAEITNEPIGTEGNTDPDDVPEPQPAASVATQRGDLWVLGNHRLLCGDGTDACDVDRLMDGHQAALVATDPPYLVDYRGDRPNDSGKDWSDVYREVEITDADQFFRGVFTNVLRVLAPHAAVYCWHAHKRQALISQVWEDLGILDHQQIVWVKPTPVFGRVYWHFRHEPCMMGWRKGSQPVHDSDHTHNSVWEVDWEGKSRIVGNEHPTQKPVELFARPMRKHTQAGDICFEPFSGSGSQLIAAEQLGRRCFAMELEPVFVEVAVRRWEAFTGKTAQRIPAGAVAGSDRSNENAATKAAAGRDA
jgi:DNA modification methylase